MAAAVGMLTALGIDTASPVTKRFDYARENLVCNEDFRDTNGLRGTLDHDITRVRQNIRRISGTIELQPNAVELALLLPWIMGGSPSGSPAVTYPLADTAPSGRYVTIDRISKVFTYSGCQVDRAIFRASQAEPLNVILEIVGLDETVGNSGTFPAISIDTANGPFMFIDLVLVSNSVTTQARDFELVIDHKIDKERFFNSATLVSAVRHDRETTMRTRVPYGDASALYATGAGGVTTTATFTNGGAVFTLSMVKTAFPRRSPFVEGRVEVMMPLEGMAYKSGSTASVVATLNPGP